MNNIAFSTSAKETLQILQRKKDKFSKSILKAIQQKIRIIQNNHHYGQPIGKRLTPKKYAEEGYTTLFRISLPHYWRMIYTITNNDCIEIIAIILDIVYHDKYNKLFGYKKK